MPVPETIAGPPQTCPASVLQRAAETAREMLGMDMSYVAETRSGEQAYVCLAGDGPSFSAAAGATVPLEGTYCDLMLQGRLANLVRDSSREPLVADLPITGDGRIGAYVGVPVVLASGETYGTFCCLSHEPVSELREREVRFLEVLAQLVADQIDERERLEEIRRREVAAGSVGALLAALAARDGYTEEHSLAVVELALAVGRRLGLDDAGLADLERAALLHDVGKLGIPDAILRKPGALTAQEWSQMRRHPVIGERIVASMPALAHLAPVVRAEHERWDGGGYPDGVGGDRIPLAARIVLACDAFHAMTSDRPYRAAMPVPDAVAEIRRNVGTQFCPVATPTVIEVIGA